MLWHQRKSMMSNLIIIYKYLQDTKSICKKNSLFRGNCQQQTLPILATYLTNFNKVNILHLFTFYIPKKSTNTAQILQILHICATAINYLDWVNKQNLGCTCHRRHHCCDEKKMIVVTHGRVSVCFRRISHCTEKLHSARDFFPPPVFQAFVTRSKVVCDKHKGWQAQRGTKGAAAFVHLPSVLILPTELHFMAERLRPIFRFFSVKPPCQYIYSRFSLDFWALEFILTAIVELTNNWPMTIILIIHFPPRLQWQNEVLVVFGFLSKKTYETVAVVLVKYKNTEHIGIVKRKQFRPLCNTWKWLRAWSWKEDWWTDCLRHR